MNPSMSIATTDRLEQVPDSPHYFVSPILEEARARRVTMLLAQAVRLLRVCGGTGHAFPFLAWPPQRADAPIIPEGRSAHYPFRAALSGFRRRLGDRYGRYTESAIAYLGPGRGHRRRKPGLLSSRGEDSRQQPRGCRYPGGPPPRTPAGRRREVLGARA